MCCRKHRMKRRRPPGDATPTVARRWLQCLSGVRPAAFSRPFAADTKRPRAPPTSPSPRWPKVSVGIYPRHGKWWERLIFFYGDCSGIRRSLKYSILKIIREKFILHRRTNLLVPHILPSKMADNDHVLRNRPNSGQVKRTGKQTAELNILVLRLWNPKLLKALPILVTFIRWSGKETSEYRNIWQENPITKITEMIK